MNKPEKVLIKDLTIPHDEYQRPERTAWVAKREFDWVLFEPITISKREDGRLFVIGGQQRIALAQKAGMTHIWACVHEGLTPAQEAEYFVRGAKDNSRISALEAYRAALRYDPVVQRVDGIVYAQGFKVGNDSDLPGVIRAAAAILWIYQIGGGELLSQVLNVLANACDRSPRALDSQSLRGLARFILSHEGAFDTAKMVRKLRMVSIAKVRSLAAEYSVMHPGHSSSAFLHAYRQVYQWRDRKVPA